MKSNNKKYFAISIVLLGDFNPGMFQPLWFLQNEIIKQSEYDFIIANNKSEMIVSSAVTDFQTGDISFHIEPKRFQIMGKNEPFEVAIDAFKKTFGSLSTIPIESYGINFSFHLPATIEEMQLFGKNLAPRKYWAALFKDDEDNNANGLTSIRMKKQEDFGALNVAIESSRAIKGIFMSFNFHHDKKDESSFAVGDIENNIDAMYSEYKKRILFLTDEIITAGMTYNGR